jgi:hypothetical protein
MLPDGWKSIAFFQGYQDPAVCPSDKTSIETKTSMKHYCNNIGREQQNCSERNRLALVSQAVGFTCLGGQEPAIVQPWGLTSFYIICEH